MLRVSFTRLSAFPRFRGQWTDAGRSAHSLSVDWQAWGTKGGLCWRATRDGLRHVPVGPPKSHNTGNQPKFLSIGTPQPPVYRRFPARTATIFLQCVSQGIPAKRSRGNAPSNRNSLLRCAPFAGAGKNALFPSRVFLARVVLGVAVGVGFGVGVRTPDSHALSNTWESVQIFGLLRNGVTT